MQFFHLLRSFNAKFSRLVDFIREFVNPSDYPLLLWPTAAEGFRSQGHAQDESPRSSSNLAPLRPAHETLACE